MGGSRIILAVDTDSLDTAVEWVKATKDYVGTYKLGLEFFLSFGAAGVQRIQDVAQSDIFLDLKLHDIPNTVAKATRAVRQLNPKFLTVHASGGSEMVAAAVGEAGDTEITAVTILTSLSQGDVAEIGFQGSIASLATSLAAASVAAGARAIVCSPLEISAIRSAVGPTTHIITPGVRMESGGDDQKRTKTPREAISDGADFIVVGRPVSGAWRDGASAMRSAAEKIATSIAG